MRFSIGGLLSPPGTVTEVPRGAEPPWPGWASKVIRRTLWSHQAMLIGFFERITQWPSPVVDPHLGPDTVAWGLSPASGLSPSGPSRLRRPGDLDGLD